MSKEKAEPEVEEAEEEEAPASMKTARGIVRNLQKKELDKLMAHPVRMRDIISHQSG